MSGICFKNNTTGKCNILCMGWGEWIEVWWGRICQGWGLQVVTVTLCMHESLHYFFFFFLEERGWNYCSGKFDSAKLTVDELKDHWLAVFGDHGRSGSVTFSCRTLSGGVGAVGCRGLSLESVEVWSKGYLPQNHLALADSWVVPWTRVVSRSLYFNKLPSESHAN